MQIAYLKQMYNRQVAGLEWNRANNHTVEVTDPKLIEELLTQPDDFFVISLSDPFLGWMTAEQAVSLVIDGGIATVQALADLETAEAKHLAKQIGVSIKTLTQWKEAATLFLENPPLAGTAEYKPGGG